jgi:polyisoprenoid-binding protein YceI
VSRFVVAAGASQMSAFARTTAHPFGYRAPITGAVEASLRDGDFDLDVPITAALEVDLDALEGDNPRVDGEMRRRLDIQRFPRVKATVLHVSAGAGDVYRLRGELTLHGKTRPMQGDAVVTLDGNQLHAKGALTIDIREFGIKPPNLLIVRVHPQIEVTIDLVADLEVELVA